MKAILYLLLLICVGFLLFENQRKQQRIDEFVAAEEQARLEKERQQLREAARKQAEARSVAENEREELRFRLDRALADRDQARERATQLEQEVARLSNSTPRPMTWFEERERSGSRLDQPPAPSSRVGYSR